MGQQGGSGGGGGGGSGGGGSGVMVEGREVLLVMSTSPNNYYINESMVSLVLRQYMRGENGTESLVGFFFKHSAMALRSVLLIRIGKQNVKIIEK